MICPKCGSTVTGKMTECAKCGYNISVDRKAHELACYFYNKGLERAGIRDIYGAIEMLNRSLQLDKELIDARNLLGLCYLEIGEAGLALSQWIISKNINDYNPVADRYLSVIEGNPVKLNHYKTAIRKYNNALEQVQQGADDLALIQLKRAVSNNPDYVKAWQLLALIYIHNEDYDRARKCLKRCMKTDVANPVSLKYVKYIRDIKFKSYTMEDSTSLPDKPDGDIQEMLEGKAKQHLVPKYNYSEEGPDYRVFISLVTGILLGIMVVYFLIVPGVKQSLNYQLLNKDKQYGEEISQYLAEMDSLEKENASLQSKIEIQQMETDSYIAQIEELTDQKYYDNVLKMVKYYYEIGADGKTDDLELYMLRQKLTAITEEELKTDAAKYLYDMVLKEYPDVMEASVAGSELFKAGKGYYDKEAYEDANEMFLLAYGESPDNEENLYLLGRTYQLIGKDADALTYYREYLNKFPSGQFAETVNQWVNAME
ncbi:MAG: tetratricopeptide repeat protein [Lachnospiraceae bacterium]